MKRPLKTVVKRHSMPPLAADLAPLGPLLRRLFSRIPFDADEHFPIGAIVAGVVDVSGHILPKSAMRAVADAVLAHGMVRGLTADRCRLTGAALVPLVRLLATSTALVDVRLRANTFAPHEAAAILRAVEVSASIRSVAFAKDALGDVVARRAACVVSENANVEALSLDDVALGPAGIRSIAHALELHNRTLTTLRLRRAALDADAATAIASALVQGPRLATLDLSRSHLSDRAMSALARGVGDSTSLQAFDVAGHRASAIGVSALADAAGGHRSLSWLNLGGGILGARGAEALAEAIVEPRSALRWLAVDCADDAVAKVLVGAVEQRGTPLTLHLGRRVRVKTRRRARALRDVAAR